MIDIIIQRHGKLLLPFSEHDQDEIKTYPEYKPLRSHILAAKKERSYRHLCCYFGSCSHIASYNFNTNMDTKDKVDTFTRILCGFVDGYITLGNGAIQWMVKSLSYANCDHPHSVEFINAGLERHAGLLKVDVDEYIRILNSKTFVNYR